jgi:CrcB protein
MFIAAGIGGIIGALFRFIVSEWFLNLRNFPFLGTVFVNLIGCFLLGYLQGFARVNYLPSWLVTGVGTGFIGAFTTFSTFSIEVVNYIKQGFVILGIIYILVSSVGGFYSVYMGFFLSTYKQRDV